MAMPAHEAPDGSKAFPPTLERHWRWCLQPDATAVKKWTLFYFHRSPTRLQAMSPRPAPHCDGRPAWSSFCLRQPTPSPRLLMHRGGLTPRLTPKRDAAVRTRSLPWSKVSTSSPVANVGQVEGLWTGLPSLCDPAACQRRRQCREVGGDEGWRGSILRPSARV